MLRTRVASSVIVVGIGVLPALWGPWGAAVAFAILGAVALAELVAMLRRIEYAVLWWLALPVVVLAPVAVAGWPAWASGALGAVAVLGPGGVLIFRRTLDGALPTWVATTFATGYLAVPLAHVVLVRGLTGAVQPTAGWLVDLEARLGVPETTRGLAWFLVALIATWFTDVGAYAAGRTLGRHKMSPLISPNKTWEGFAGGIVFAVISVLVTNRVFGVGLHPAVAVVVGIIIALAAVVGDLAESLLKRQTGVKDTGTLIPGHGGVLDRLDSQLFVFVVVYYVALGLT